MLNSTVRPTEKLAAVVAPVLEQTAAGALSRRPFALELWDGSVVPASTPLDPPVCLRVRSPRALARLLHAPGELGLARAWVAGELELDGDAERALAALADLARVRLRRSDRVRLLLLARRLGAVSVRAPRPPAVEARVRGARHSLRRDRAAVRHHYDVPTSFYRLVLGPSLVYSCAYFASPDEPLEVAQERKLDLVCRKLALEPGERLLDVGCGWGSLVLHAAQRYGVRAVGITLSPEQAREARRRVAEAGLEGRVEIRVADYRQLDDGPYDKVASVGMVEHVGVALLDTYARRLAALVRPGGRVLNHGIVRLVPKATSDDSFVGRYVFPDGELHPLSASLTAFERAGLEVRDVEALREHYALTLRAWSRNLARNREAAVAQAGAERERVWRLYMAGSALMFERGEIGVCQTLVVRPGAPHGLAPLRPWPQRATAPGAAHVAWPLDGGPAPRRHPARARR
ncbi:MAG TPA: cyclopropane-fatty-acyl-phospholipid synthase family protein [Conexibacter sp.]|nr:cyclopropane-fatty-acyl-phospholipid synthase family protein [Conexibacter sp.]